ncbi:Histone acetyltransferase, component of the RNA polymerase elongator complex [Clostridium amylolyticum]|uniref:Histone acetyltransferase, component of the RNA polymerase elongator complex n=1 Tax=Clostridium amylolyticum TaxID=1121298 RepID=A0A1M6D811_9CLOT|nr:radical SAM protein [Clostridium amylolyticum]SHI69339.1 Histone acetyltransferase, component of the RNA polymerase elongator complex [Clostridium amylolyticum]
MSKNHYIIPVFVPHLGCPHNCVFCNQNIIASKEEQVTAESSRKIIEEYLKTINKSNSTIEVSFFGGTFTAIDIYKQKELLAVAKEYKDKGYIDYIRLSTRPDYINKDILAHLKSFSVDIIELGVQSLDDEVLMRSGRGHTRNDVYLASKLIKDTGFVLGHQIMLGLPGDTFEKDIKTVMESISMDPDICRIYPALVIKDTPMEIMYRKELYKPYTLDEAVEITKKIYSLYHSKNIPIIRVGLQPTDSINVNGDIISGPFHPAFRELVESSIINDLLYDYLKDKKGQYTILINSKDISKLYSDKKRYFLETKNKLKDIFLHIKIENDTPKGVIKLISQDDCIILSIYEYMLTIAHRRIF